MIVHLLCTSGEVCSQRTLCLPVPTLFLLFVYVIKVHLSSFSHSTSYCIIIALKESSKTFTNLRNIPSIPCIDCVCKWIFISC